MSLGNSQLLKLLEVPSQNQEIVYSHSKDKSSRLTSLSNSKTHMSEKTTLVNNGSPERKKPQNLSPSKYQKAVQFAKKTLFQLKYKKKIRQNQLKITRIKQKCSKILTSSKSTNVSNENDSKNEQNLTFQHNSKIHQQLISTATVSNPLAKIQLTTQSKGINSADFINFKTHEGDETFIILKYVNGGSFGKVYLAQNIKNLAVFSIKIIPRKLISKEIEYQLFRQIKIQMFLNHPNIIKLYHFFVDSENIYLVLEPCLGNDLYKNLKGSAENLNEKQLSKILKQICQAVQYMHKNDIIHRDIKPQNILIHENVVKLCDFGWAIYSPLLRDTQCGTPLYSSPEMLKKQYYDSKIDVWCIGVLAYELLYGTIPFQIHQVADLDKIVEEEIYFSKQIQISREAKSFIMACMNKNPYHRYNIRQALQHPFINGCDKYRCTIA